MLRAELPAQRNRTLYLPSNIAGFSGQMRLPAAPAPGCAGCVGGAGGFRRAADLALAAIFGEVGNQRVHRIIVRAVKDVAAFAMAGDKAGTAKLAGMKAEHGRRQLKPGCDLAGAKANGSLLHQQAENTKPGVLSKGGQGIDDRQYFHISINIKIKAGVKGGDEREAGNRKTGGWGGSHTRPFIFLKQ